MLKRWIVELYGDALLIRERLFNIILTAAIVAMAVAFGTSFFLGDPRAALFLGPSILFMLGLLLITHRTKRMTPAAVAVELFITLVLFPIEFFLSGGVHSGMMVWVLLGLVFVFLLFSGKALVVMLIENIAATCVLYFLAYHNVLPMIPLDSELSIYMDSLVTIILVGCIIGALIQFQVWVFTRECDRTERQKAEIEDISRTRSAFFANMSHEIRTPINTIIGLNEMTLRERDISDEVAENSASIQNAGRMLLSIVNDILDMSKIESGKMEIVPVQYSTATILGDLVNAIWGRAQEKHLDFKLDISETLPSALYGDEVRIKQVLLNLLTNAIKYTREGSVTLSARCDQLDTGRVRLVFAVADTGIGIRKEDIQKLFATFQRVDEKLNRNIEGTGLGLSISQQLTALMGGKIEVDSIYTKGSTFTVSLEQEVVDATPLGPLNLLQQHENAAHGNYHQSFEAPEARVLVVDDNAMNLLVVTKLLRSTKVQVDTASSGAECLEKTRTQYYNVIFMDHKMPEMDGVEALNLLRKQENGLCCKVPVLALTANAMSGADNIYQELGFQGYLAKPVSGALLEATLLRFLPDELVSYSAAEPGTAEAETVRMVRAARKKPICITTDCVCDLPREWLAANEVPCMYYYVVTGKGRFSDLDEINSDNLISYLAQPGSNAHSEPASAEEYEAFFADALTKATRVIHIAMAKGASVAYESACAAARCFDHVTVVNSGHLSSGMGLMVMKAAEMAQQGHTAEEILAELDAMRPRVSTSFIVPDAGTLYRSGKVSRWVNIVCGTLAIHPVLSLHQDKIRCRRVEFGEMQSAYRRYIRRQLLFPGRIDTRLLFVTFAGCNLHQQQFFRQEIAKCARFDRIIFQKASATISSNCGMGCVGLLYLRKK